MLPMHVLATAEEEKRHKYRAATKKGYASFSPFVVLVDGVMEHDAVFCVFCFVF